MNTDLAKKKCVPCEGGVPPLSQSEAKNFLGQISDSWQLKESKIIGNFKFKNFALAMEFVNKVANIAEKENHHPDIKINYNKVKLELFTHAINGLSENDFILGAKVDNIN
jgi:4a-hydroxytetrahydrobiopterin dehydratase